VSDQALRRLIVLVLVLVVVCFIGGTVAAYLARTTAHGSSFGPGGFGASLVFYTGLLSFPPVGALIVRRQPRNPIGVALLGHRSDLGPGQPHYGLRQLGMAPSPSVRWGVPGVHRPRPGALGTRHRPDRHFSPALVPERRIGVVPVATGDLDIRRRTAPGLDRDHVHPGRRRGQRIPGVPEPRRRDGAEGATIGSCLEHRALIPSSILVSAASLVVRFRRSRGVEHLQLKWLAGAAGAVAVISPLAMVSTLPAALANRAQPLWGELLQDAALFSLVLIPIGVGVAVLRYRLYDFDVVINKALVYGLLTGLLALLYAALVLAFGALARGLGSSSGSPLVVAASTLAAAALFRPFGEASSRSSTDGFTGESTMRTIRSTRSPPGSAITSISTS
jgi:hypothetical protein